MSHNKSLSLAIGAFVAGALLLAFGALLFFSGDRLFAEKERVVMYFTGSVQGLLIGAPVKLKGVVLGEISEIQISFVDSGQGEQQAVTFVSADLEMQRINTGAAPADRRFLRQAIDDGLRAQLNFQSLLTGLLYVELDFHPDSQAILYNQQQDALELPTRATEFEELSRKFQNINLEGLVTNINALAVQISALVESGAIQQTLSRADSALAAIEQSANRLDSELEKLGSDLHQTLDASQATLQALRTEAPRLSAELQASLAKFDQSLQKFDQAAANIGHTFSEDGLLVNQLDTSLQDVSRAARALRQLSESLDAEPDALWRGREEEN